MILVEKISEVAGLLLNAASSESIVSFVEFHKCFDSTTPDRDKYETLESASRALSASQIAIYSVVLAKVADGCPGIGFYDIFNNIRRPEFFDVTGHNSINDLNDEQKKRIAHLERIRVYEHAAKQFNS